MLIDELKENEFISADDFYLVLLDYVKNLLNTEILWIGSNNIDREKLVFSYKKIDNYITLYNLVIYYSEDSFNLRFVGFQTQYMVIIKNKEILKKTIKKKIFDLEM